MVRLNSLIEQVQARYILVHDRTRQHIVMDTLEIERILLLRSMQNIDCHDEIVMPMDSIAYIIFTSGSTGIPKVVPISHKNFQTCIISMADQSIMRSEDIIIQTTPMTFDIHMLEILGSFWLGSTLCLLRPKGNLDMCYYTSVVEQHGVTLSFMVPTLISVLAQYLQNYGQRRSSISSIQCLCSLGEALQPKTASAMYELMNPSIRFYNLYGPAECTLISTFHRIIPHDFTCDSVPIGRPLGGYQYKVLDAFFQPVFMGQQVGELFVGGDGVFKGYLNQSDLTKESLIDLPGTKSLFYRTGDLVRVDIESNTLYYVGRTDFQVKIRGQRIELGHIEATIRRLSSEITNCVVIKYFHNDSEQLVAYIQTVVHLNVDTLREQCLDLLPATMVPALFVLIEQFPFNINGKIDRKALPPPDFSFQSNEALIIDNNRMTEMEQKVASIWTEILGLDQIPSKSQSFFRLGGHSLLLIKLHYRYEVEFKKSLNLCDFFFHTTISDHVLLLKNNQIAAIESRWQPFNITEGSFN